MYQENQLVRFNYDRLRSRNLAAISNQLLLNKIIISFSSLRSVPQITYKGLMKYCYSIHQIHLRIHRSSQLFQWKKRKKLPSIP